MGGQKGSGELLQHSGQHVNNSMQICCVRIHTLYKDLNTPSSYATTIVTGLKLMSLHASDSPAERQHLALLHYSGQAVASLQLESQWTKPGSWKGT